MATDRLIARPSSMLALLPTGADPPVRLGEVALPTPAADEALVAVEAFSINRGETFLLERPRPGWRPGKDIAGRVLRAAADGSGPACGARVVGHPAQAGWAQVAAVPTAALAVIPAELDSVTAAALPLAGLTALRLVRTARPVAGERVLLTGASGGVGHYLTELASEAGVAVTAVSATRERARRLRALGATQTVHDIHVADGPFDVAFESVGGSSLPIALSLLKKGGRLVWFGQASRQPITLDFFDYFRQTGAAIRHFHYEDDETPVVHDLATLVWLVASGRLHPELGLVADWKQTGEALAALRQRRLVGNAVLRVNPPLTIPTGALE
jgi:NADPH:quinone reductase